MINEIVCHLCAKYCVLKVSDEDGIVDIQGNECEKGVEYGKRQLVEKSAIFTSLVRIKGANSNVVPVKSSKPISKKLWIECSIALSRLYVGAPIKIGDIVCKNILNTGVDMICTKNMDKI